jgi:hypothetical protein
MILLIDSLFSIEWLKLRSNGTGAALFALQLGAEGFESEKKRM